MNNGIDCVVLSSILFAHIQSNCVKKRLRSLAAIFHSACVWNFFLFPTTVCCTSIHQCISIMFLKKWFSVCCWDIRISVNDLDFPKCRYNATDAQSKENCDNCLVALDKIIKIKFTVMPIDSAEQWMPLCPFYWVMRSMTSSPQLYEAARQRRMKWCGPASTYTQLILLFSSYLNFIRMRIVDGSILLWSV